MRSEHELRITAGCDNARDVSFGRHQDGRAMLEVQISKETAPVGVLCAFRTSGCVLYG